VVVLDFLSSWGWGVLVRYQKRLRGWYRVRAVRSWSESEGWARVVFRVMGRHSPVIIELWSHVHNGMIS